VGGERAPAVPYVDYDEVEAVCSDCGRLFLTEEALREHRAEAHAGEDSVVSPGRPAKAVSCSVCHQPFRSTNALQTHSRRTHG
jgi:hypothetical protein